MNIFRKERLFINGIMEKSNKKIINSAKHLLYSIHTGQQRRVCNLCKKNILWKYNHSYSKGAADETILKGLNTIIRPSAVKRLEHTSCYLHKLSENQIIITGIYCIHKSEDESIKKYYFDYTIVFSDGLASYIQIIGNNIPVKIHKVVSITETVYNIQEDELLYVEAMGGHVLWHCKDATIESVGLLKNVERKLSGDFVKVHRSYMVNKKLVKIIQRCSVTMVNGEVVPIPYKKYVGVKKKLMEE